MEGCRCLISRGGLTDTKKLGVEGDMESPGSLEMCRGVGKGTGGF